MRTEQPKRPTLDGQPVVSFFDCYEPYETQTELVYATVRWVITDSGYRALGLVHGPVRQ